MNRPVKRLKRWHVLTSLLLVYLSVFVWSCSSNIGLLADGGIRGTGISIGIITGFGSVFVNGVEFDTTGAVVTLEGQAGSESDLDVGMVVRVEGTFDTSTGSGIAATISFEDILEGPVEAIDGPGRTLVVMGQDVVFNAATVFAGFDSVAYPLPLDLALGNILEVSGLQDGTGSIQATRIEKTAASFDDLPVPQTIEIKGRISVIDTVSEVLFIGSLEVDYSNAVAPASPPEPGQRIKVTSDQDLSSGILIASSVEVWQGLTGGTGGWVIQIDGVVDDFVSSTEFEVGDQPVTTSPATVYAGGDASRIEAGARLIVSGTLVDWSGTLILEAARVTFIEPSTVEVRAAVENVISAEDRVVLLGVNVFVTDLTIMDDQRDSIVDFSVANILTGDWLIINAYVDPNGDVVATRVVRDGADSVVLIQGPVSNIVQPDFDILGVHVATENGSTQYKDQTGNSIEIAEFFDPGNLFDGRVVRVYGPWNEAIGTIAADEAQHH